MRKTIRTHAHGENCTRTNPSVQQQLNLHALITNGNLHAPPPPQQQQQQHLFKHDENYSGADVVVYLRS